MQRSILGGPESGVRISPLNLLHGTALMQLNKININVSCACWLIRKYLNLQCSSRVKFKIPRFPKHMKRFYVFTKDNILMNGTELYGNERIKHSLVKMFSKIDLLLWHFSIMVTITILLTKIYICYRDKVNI